MKLVVGLGNPGPQYDRTRHNVGFMALDALARRVAPGEVARSRFGGVVIETTLKGEKTLLLKPLTFMNLSGNAVSEAVRFHKLDARSDLLVIVDDVALACGLIRVKASGSAGGHNGLADIERKLGTADYARLRVGIDPPGQIPQKDYVLGRFRPDQIERLEPALDESVDAALLWADEGVEAAMNRFNRKNPNPQETA